MRLPRRVPWKSIAELDQVCSWIFSDEHDLYSKNLAINRLSAWRAITPLPHALDSTLAILSVIVQDAKAEGASLFLLLRQSYASALIRLVNGLVDPLQLGVYARSIAGIAAQLDLPLWLVELRHAATHEDLPSLEVLREAAKQQHPHNTKPPLRPLSPILKQYKDLLKLTTRDASLKSRYKQSVQTIYKDIEKWIAEAKVAANVMSGELGWTTSGIADNAEGEQDPRERWALEILCDALLEKGGLVPLSKKRRTLPDDSPTSPPLGSVEIWSPLLIHIHSAHPAFFSNLATKIIYRLTADAQMSSKAPESPMVFDSSYATCLCRWLLWTVEFVESEDPDDGLRIDAFSMLITAIGPGSELSSQSKKVLEALMQDLCSGKADLDLALLALKPFDRSSSAAWSADDIVVMNERLDALLSVGGSLSEDETTSVTHDKPSIISALGWSLLDEASGWKPCPLGVYYDK
ncbi:rRNA-processing protein las1 [Paramarasmius palmivorus]|uniref:rRNA-processing protein las1 n=1 Tax=Paramarasmius palmivorus TaxID=297713 RepID=A0AAW0E3K9_9AGAR